jgi:predicted anti-sigma-YlaC factor YlaD
MAISYSQVMNLLSSIAIAVSDQLDCDGCFELISEFAEAELRGETLSENLKKVELHLQQCPCCAYEYEALLEAVRMADMQ